MSIVKVRAALETALNAMTPAIQTAWENSPFTPTVGTEYQRAYLMLGDPINDEWGARYQENGYLQIDLNYPLLSGPNASDQRFELIRTTFKRGTTLTNSGVSVIIQRTPAISPAYVSGDRFIRPVKIRFFAYIDV